MKKRQELLRQASEKYKNLQFRDDFLFCKILSTNTEIARDLLELILNMKIRKVKVKPQAPIEITAEGRGIRLDVFVEDDDNSVYDLEMQTTKKTDLGKRSRYYQGMIDLKLIERGAKFRELKKSYIIFICMKDPFKEGRHIYTFENICRESPELKMGDDTYKVFLNASGKLDDVSENLLDFFELLKTGRGNTELCNRIELEVERAREHSEWRTEYMTLYMRDQENIEKGRAEEREIWEKQQRQSIERMLRTKRFKNQEIAELLDISVEKVDAVEKNLLTY